MPEIDNAGSQASSGHSDEDVRPFRNRVRVLAEVVNDPNEVAVASAVFRQRGCLVRAPENEEVDGYPGQNRAWLVIEVRFSGSTRSAARHAWRYIESLAGKFCLGVWVRRVEVVEFPPERDVPYYIDTASSDWLASRPALARLLRPIGSRRTTGLLMAAPGLEESAVRGRLTSSPLGRPFDPSRNSLRPVIDWSLVDDPAARQIGLLAAAASTILACGLSVGWSSGQWKAIPLGLGIALVIALVIGMSRGQPPRQRAYKALPLVLFLAAGVLAGTLTPDHNPGILAITAVGVGAAYLAGRGVFLALRDSWFTKQAAWGIPLTLTAVPPLALYLGGAYDMEYLTSRFGIPADAVSVSAFYRLAITSRTVLLGLGFFVVAVAVIGWARYFHGLSDGDRWMPLLISAVTLAIYLLVALSLGLLAVNNAANDAAAAARAGRQPASYYGIQGILECVKPVVAHVPVYDAPLPTGRPVLSFGATGNWLWVWDPGSGRSIGTPLADITVTRATGTPARCP